MVVQKTTDNRVLVFTTTFFPMSGPAEDALISLATQMPEVHFDVITTLFSPQARDVQGPVSNITIHRVGRGAPSDKYLLPILAYRKARELHTNFSYLFAWSIMASYGTIAAVMFKKSASMPLLISMADQKIDGALRRYRFVMKYILNAADQVSTACVLSINWTVPGARNTISLSSVGRTAVTPLIETAIRGNWSAWR